MQLSPNPKGGGPLELRTRVIGILITAVVLAGVAATVAVVMGMGWWIAFLIYALGGALVVLAFVAVAALRPDSADDVVTAEDHVSHQPGLTKTAQARSGARETDTQHPAPSTEIAR